MVKILTSSTDVSLSVVVEAVDLFFYSDFINLGLEKKRCHYY